MRRFFLSVTRSTSTRSITLVEHATKETERMKAEMAAKGQEVPVAPDNTGLNTAFGNRAAHVMKGMLGPSIGMESRESTATPILGKATINGTAYTMRRSTTFEKWCHICPPPVGWHLSKLGNTTCKFGHETSDAIESIQLQLIRGCNVIEIPGTVSESHQKMSTAIVEALAAFELERDGFVFVARCGVLRQEPWQEEQTEVHYSNVSATRSRIAPIFERYKASVFPSMQLKSGFKLDALRDDQLASLGLRRLSAREAAGLTPDWIDAFLTNITHQMKLETIDVLLLDGFHALYVDGPERTPRKVEDVENDIRAVFAYCEAQALRGGLQYYGVASPSLAPPVVRHPPPVPHDAAMPARFINPPPPWPIIDLRRLMELAKEVGGEGHRMRFVQTPMNLTEHTAWSAPLPYSPRHTLVTLARELGLTVIGCRPIETTDLQGQPQRYHGFPMEGDLKATRMNLFAVLERAVMKEMEVSEAYQKGPKTLPPMEEVFLASLFLCVQRQFSNLFFFDEVLNFNLMPKFRRALNRLRESSPADMKEWATQYDLLINDLFKMRRRLFSHKHGVKSWEIDAAIDRAAPSLRRCPMMTQKAINFSTHCCDVVLTGMHFSRYFHEATELNPAQGGDLVIPPHELDALCRDAGVTYADVNPPDPYMYDQTAANTRSISGQKPRGVTADSIIDPNNPKFPDIAEGALPPGGSANLP